jgi:hypothetical protein
LHLEPVNCGGKDFGCEFCWHVELD